MPPIATTETRFALEGFVSLGMIIVLGILLLGISWFFARRDRRYTERPRLIFLLFLLRCSAILILLWMLAGPTLVTITRRLQTKSVALFIDTSASMGLVDTIDGSGNVSRWALARGKQPNPTVLKLDEAVATLQAARRQLSRFGSSAANSPAARQAAVLLNESAAGIDRGLDLIKASARDLPSTDASFTRELNTAVESLESAVAEIVREKAAQQRRGKSLGALQRDQWLPRVSTMFSAGIDQLEQSVDRHVSRAEGGNATANLSGDSTLSRLDKVESWLAAAEDTWLKKIRAKAAVAKYEFSDEVKALPIRPSSKAATSQPAGRTLAPATHLGAPFQQIAMDNINRPADVAIVITDGGHNHGQDPRELAASLGVTALHIVPIGNTRMQRDVILHHTHVPKAAFLNDKIVVDSVVTAYDCARESISVELLANNAVVDRQTLTVTSEMFDARVQMLWKADKLGPHTLSCRVLPVARERSEENNATKATVQVMEDKIRVLLADNFPRWEFRYLVNLFKRDERVEFDQLLFEPQTAPNAPRSSFPDKPDDWARYRVVILGDLQPAQLTSQHQQLLRDYVTDHGGNVIIIAGRDAMPDEFVNQPLGEILPVEKSDAGWRDNRPWFLQVSSEGADSVATQLADTPQASERIWREMSQRLPIYGLSKFSRPKSTGHSLIAANTQANRAGGEDRSFLSWQYVGRGRVVFVAAPVTYQLRYGRGDTFHHRFWGQLLRWTIARDLAEGSRTVRLSTDKTRYEQGDAVQALAKLAQMDGKPVRGADCRVLASQGGKVVQEISLIEDPARPGTYAGMFDSLPDGQITLRLVGPQITTLLATEKYRRPVETLIQIEPGDGLELRHPLCNMPLLRQLADASDGMIVPPTGLEAALEQLNLAPQTEETISKKPLWNRWDLFWVFIICLTLEWAGRKYAGLS